MTMTMARVQVLCLVVCSFVSFNNGQIPIPRSRLGYVFNGGSNNAQISLDIHMGPLCPDSRDALPTAKAVAMRYGADTLRLTLHMFPLPYHHHSFYTAVGARSVLELRDLTAAYKWFDLIYANLDKLSNTATIAMTTNQVLGMLAEYANMVGIDRQQFLDTMAKEELDTDTRAAWKYSCSRAVVGTPTFFLNDVPIAADASWTLADWEKMIDPLLQKQQIKTGNTTCPFGVKKCEYLPGKIECCKRGENCIPNVGCRCLGDSCGKSQLQKTCPSDTNTCEYLPGKVECCKDGEGCIPNVGCRCWGKYCKDDTTEYTQIKASKVIPIA